MIGKIRLMLIALALTACTKDGQDPDYGINYEYGRQITHEKIVLGDRLENPYKTENISRALQSLYPVKADRVEVKTTDLYVRFLPADDQEYEMLESLGIELVDHPLDYEITVEGDWYHDPSVPEGNVTWQYAVVPDDFVFPDMEYEVIDECHISEFSPGTRADGIDWAEVEREAYRLTGNEGMLSPADTKASSKVTPSGRITIVDDNANGGKPFGVAGVKVVCNSFVKFDSSYTDRDGYYKMDKTYSSKLRYRIVFQNDKGFDIGVNLVLVPASVSTLGKAGPEGINMTVTKDSETKLFRRCVVNNAAYDYFSRCGADDMNISSPPADLRIWIINAMGASSAVMMHHGAFVEHRLISSFLGEFTKILKFLLPDITIGTKGRNDYRSIYSATCHELAHASHFTKVGKGYWDKYISYIVESYVMTGGMTYGDGSADNAGYCEVGEMWAYYLESKMYKDRYGGSFPTFGTSYWFYPQIFRYLDERGLKCSDMFSVLDGNVTSRAQLKTALIRAFPSSSEMIEQVFSRY
ncbi:MAG: hypothetical protein E7118_07785 [Bacteroidales bacterium]|nr:hypothetical protein [Bacteroidales bacterium]